jgi:UDP-N-acetylmuramyl pentapeptide phosphotransferase/UDP-N-acetylglucosamine-1-phosphate transferase
MWAQWNSFVITGVLVMMGMAALGAFDDLTKVAKARSLGLTPRQKLFGQIAIGCALAAAMTFTPGLNRTAPALGPVATSATAGAPSVTFPGESGSALSQAPLATSLPPSPTVIQVPLFGTFDLGWLYWPFVIAVIVGASNAVNLTDGLDGLAAGVTAVALLPYLCMAYVCGHLIFARHLGVLYLPGSGELAVLCASLFGGCLAFLWYNAHPAEVFMGDTGSLAIGGALGAIAVTTRTEVFLALIGGVYVAEALSVIIQVSYFKWTKGGASSG